MSTDVLDRTPTRPSAAQVPAARADAAPGRALRDSFGRLPSGVCVITTDGASGQHGMTASSVCSLSLSPALLLVCIAETSATLQALRSNGHFAVNVLSAAQSSTSGVFASRLSQGDKFAGTPHRSEHGLPVLDDATAWFACDVHDLLPGGDHTIVVGRISHWAQNDREPLVWHAGTYRRLIGP